MITLNSIYYGNTLFTWIQSLLIILACFVGAKIIYWISGNIIKKLTRKTKTKLDDILVDMIEEPIVLAITLIGINIALNNLVLPELVTKWTDGIYTFLITINIGWFVSRFFESLYKEYLVPLADKSESDLDDQILPILRKGIKFIIWAVVLLIGLNNAGYDVGAVLAGLGIGGLAFAMAAKDTIANIFGGFTIFTDKPFKLKDRIQISGFDGTVEEIGLRSTKLRTLAGRVVTIPNSQFAGSPVENVTREPNRKVVLNIGLTYDTTPKDMEKAMDILKKISENNQHVRENYKMSFNAFNDFSMNILFIYHIKKHSDILKTQTEMNIEILKEFNKNKIEMAFPTQTIYQKKA